MSGPLTEAQLYAQYQGGDPAHAKPAHAKPGLSEQELYEQYTSGQRMGWLEDTGRSLVTGLERGATGIAATPRSLADMQDQATLWAVNQARHAMGQPPLTHAQEGQVHQVGHAVEHGSPLGMISPDAPSGASLDRHIQAVAGPYHEPQGWQGRLAEKVGEMVPNALLPGGAVARVARVAAPAVGSFAGGELTQGTPYQHWAELGGSLVGGLGEGAVEGAFAAPERVIGRATENLTPDQAQAAATLRARMADQGIHLTIPEAVQQVTNGATGLGRVQRLVENTSRSAPQMSEYFANRPDQIRHAVGGFVSDVAPNMPTNPGLAAREIQGAAEGAINNAKRVSNAYAKPAYDALAGQSLSDADHARLMANPAYAEALGQLRGNPTLADLLTPEDNTLANVNQTVKRLRQMADNATPSPVRQFGDATLSSQYGNAGDMADALARAASPQYGAARDTVAAGRAALVDPLQAGPVGGLSTGRDLGSQAEAAFPANPYPGHAATLADQAPMLDFQNPDALPNLTAAHLGQKFGQSTRDLTGGPNQYGGAAFARNVAGNAEQHATLGSAFDAIDPSGDLASRFSDLLEGLQATGRRERPGSLTAFNAEDQAALKAAPPAIKNLGAFVDPLEWGKNLSNWTGGKLYGRNMTTLADLLTDPDTMAVLSAARGAGGAPGSAQLLLPLLTQQSGAGQ